MVNSSLVCFVVCFYLLLYLLQDGWGVLLWYSSVQNPRPSVLLSHMSRPQGAFCNWYETNNILKKIHINMTKTIFWSTRTSYTTSHPRPSVIKIYITHIFANMPYNSSKDQSNFIVDPLGPPRGLPCAPGCPFTSPLIPWGPIDAPLAPLGPLDVPLHRLGS